ncbi:Dsl1-C domain-containing protein [Mycena indigotica]|uniref:Dsl1-C domain-containing protein n=1 Tax=Mycena indigotica TaxID=2126181 RepID=A0A8H6T2Z1_9AGAR|nr:Dsl1-C domain-containing protein [Mycena indigotica]KAF7309900.1 Dsl1-C domain-containing protein [Mycena indigotica]
MAFPIPDHLPRRPNPKDVSSEILLKIDKATNQTLSAELAASWLTELDGTIQNTKQQIHHRIHRDLPLFEQQFETSKSVQTRLQALSTNVENLDRTLSDPEAGIIPALVRSLTAHAVLAQQATNAAVQHEAVLYLLRCRKSFTGVLSLVQLGKLPEAVVACDEFEQEHLQFVPPHLSQTSVFADLKRKFQAAKSKTEEQLSEAYSRSIVILAQTLTVLRSVVVRQSDNVLSLSDVLSSLTPTARANHLTILRRDMVAYYVDQLLLQPATLSSSSEHDEQRLTVIPSPPNTNNPIERLENVSLALKFLSKHFTAYLPLSDKASVSRALCKPIGSSILSNLLIPSLPVAFHGLPAFLQLAERAVAFEGECIVQLLGGDEHDRPIKIWIDNLSGHYERRRRMLILDNARLVVLAPEVVGDHGKFVVEVDPFLQEKKAALPDIIPVQKEMIGFEQKEDVDEWGFDEGTGNGDGDDGWGFDDDSAPEPIPQSEPREMVVSGDDDNWGFDDEPVGPPDPNGDKDDGEDAWGWNDEESSGDTAWEDDPWNETTEKSIDDPPSPPKSAATTLASPVPARKATRLEKLANKGKKHLNGSSPLASPTPPITVNPNPVPESLKPPVKRPPELTSPLVAVAPKESYLVTHRTKQIVAIVKEVLAEGQHFTVSRMIPIRHGSGSEPGALILQSAASVVDLYRALYPVQFSGRLKTVVDAPMQLSNDCMYLSEEIRRLERTLVGPPNVKEKLVDCGDRLKVWGDSWFQDTIDQHRASIDETIAKGAEGFTFLADQDRYDDCEAAIGRAVQEIKRLSQRWKGILTKTKYYTAVGLVTDAALSRLLEDVLALPDITEVESHRLHEIFRMLSGLEALFIEDANQQPFAADYVPSWFKFSYLTELMDASMVDIVDLFESGALRDFEVDELAREEKRYKMWEPDRYVSKPMSRTYNNVIVFGPTGTVGGLVALEAHQRGAKVWLAMRDTSKPIDGITSTVEQAGNFVRVQADLSDPASVSSAITQSGATAAYLYLVHTPDFARATLRAMRDAGVEYIVFLSSYTIRLEGVPLREIKPDRGIAYANAQAEINIEEAGFPYFTTLRPARFASNYRKFWFDGAKALHVFPDSVMDNIAPEDIGAVGGAVLVNRPSEEKETIYLYGPELRTAKESWEVIKNITGREIDIAPLTAQHYTQVLLTKGLPNAAIQYLLALDRVNVGFPQQEYQDAVGNVEKYAGRQPTKFSDYIQAHKAEWLA